MSIVNGTFSLTCSKCSKQHDFTSVDADFDFTSSDERPMGAENCYSWETEFNCDKCGNTIEIEYEVWEYPQGAFNMDEVKISGGTKICRFDYDFIGEPEPDDM